MQRKRRLAVPGHATVVLAAAALAVAGCTGAIDRGASGADRGRDDAPSSGPSPTTGGAGPPGAGGGTSGPTGAGGAGVPPGSISVDGVSARQFQRLSRVEYLNTVRDLLGDTGTSIKDLPADQVDASGFNTGGVVAVVDARQLMNAAEAIGQRLLPRLAAMAACMPGQPDGDCAATFIKALGRRAYRRALASDDVMRLQTVYDRARAAGQDFANALRVVVQAMLQSSELLYHWELGPRSPTLLGQRVKLTDDEVAARLSYLVWRSMPDDTLYAAAAAGRLGTPEEIEAQARRLLADKRAQDGLVDFHAQWLGVTDLDAIDKDTTLFPAWSPALVADLDAELRGFLGLALLGEGKGRFDALLTAPYTTATPALAKIYGVKSGAGSAAARLDLDPRQRGGLLTQLAFLSRNATRSTSHPIKRGHMIAKNLLCLALPPPPANVPAPKPPAPNLTTRERFAEHSKNDCAKGCHGLFDPFGFALEHYDAIGAWRTTDGGKPVDATATIVLGGAPPVDVDGAVDLAQKIATSDAARGCYADGWFRYALARPRAAGDDGVVADLRAGFAAAQYDVRELVVALARSRSFSYRMLSDGEAGR